LSELEPFNQEKFEELQKERIYYHARFCWKNRHHVTPSGITWEQQFLKNTGISLDAYVKQKQEENVEKDKRK